jgi:hypothetical protein
MQGVFGGGLADADTAHALRLGGKIFYDLTVFVPRGRVPQMDVDGLLPTWLFQTIFISHAGRFVIFEPSVFRPQNFRTRYKAGRSTDHTAVAE